MAKPKTDTLIALICKAITERYSSDPSAPSLLIAHVPNLSQGPRWYFTIKRYRDAFGGGGFNQLRTADADLDHGIRELAKLVAPVDEAQRELAAAVAA